MTSTLCHAHPPLSLPQNIFLTLSENPAKLNSCRWPAYGRSVLGNIAKTPQKTHSMRLLHTAVISRKKLHSKVLRQPMTIVEVFTGATPLANQRLVHSNALKLPRVSPISCPPAAPLALQPRTLTEAGGRPPLSLVF